MVRDKKRDPQGSLFWSCYNISMNLSRFFKNNFSLISQIIFLILIVYVIFILGRSIYKNYQTNQKIVHLEEEVKQLEQEKVYSQNLIVYYQSPNFKELEARKKLNLKKPNEKVMAIEPQKDSGGTESLENIYFKDFELGAKSTDVVIESNVRKWKEFIFNK